MKVAERLAALTVASGDELEAPESESDEEEPLSRGPLAGEDAAATRRRVQREQEQREQRKALRRRQREIMVAHRAFQRDQRAALATALDDFQDFLLPKPPPDDL